VTAKLQIDAGLPISILWQALLNDKRSSNSNEQAAPSSGTRPAVARRCRAGSVSARLPAGVQLSSGVRLRYRQTIEQAVLGHRGHGAQCLPKASSTRPGMAFTAPAPLEDALLRRAVFAGSAICCVGSRTEPATAGPARTP